MPEFWNRKWPWNLTQLKKLFPFQRRSQMLRFWSDLLQVWWSLAVSRRWSSLWMNTGTGRGCWTSWIHRTSGDWMTRRTSQLDSDSWGKTSSQNLETGTPSKTSVCSLLRTLVCFLFALPLPADTQPWSLLGLLAKITCLVGISPIPWTGQVWLAWLIKFCWSTWDPVGPPLDHCSVFRGAWDRQRRPQTTPLKLAELWGLCLPKCVSSHAHRGSVLNQ